METLIAWALLLLIGAVVVALIRFAGPPGKASPHCGTVKEGSRPNGGCH